jgi:hypothetical protein
MVIDERIRKWKHPARADNGYSRNTPDILIFAEGRSIGAGRDQSAPTGGRSRVFHGMIGPDGWPGYFVHVHNRAPKETKGLKLSGHRCSGSLWTAGKVW